MAIVETLLDLLSAASGALVGATVTALFNHGKRRQLSDQVVLGQRALDKMQAENKRLLGVIQDRENTILQMQMKILQDDAKQDAAMAAKKSTATKTTRKRRK